MWDLKSPTNQCAFCYTILCTYKDGRIIRPKYTLLGRDFFRNLTKGKGAEAVWRESEGHLSVCQRAARTGLCHERGQVGTQG